MKITFIGIALGEIPLSKLHRSNRIVGKINNLLDDPDKHIGPDMTGNDIIEWYNGLEESVQTLVERVNLFDKAEREYIVKDLQGLKEDHQSKKTAEKRMYQLSVGFVATTMVLISLFLTGVYYITAKHNKLLVESHMVHGIKSLFINAETIISPGQDKPIAENEPMEEVEPEILEEPILE